MQTQDGKPQPTKIRDHYFTTDNLAEHQIQACLSFFKQQGLTFFDMEEAKIQDTHQGKQRYITISVSIKVS